MPLYMFFFNTRTSPFSAFVNSIGGAWASALALRIGSGPSICVTSGFTTEISPRPLFASFEASASASRWASLTAENYSVVSGHNSREVAPPREPPPRIMHHEPQRSDQASARLGSSLMDSDLSQNFRRLELTQTESRIQSPETVDAVAEELAHPTLLLEWLNGFNHDDYTGSQGRPRSQTQEPAPLSRYSSASIAVRPSVARTEILPPQEADLCRAPPSIEEVELRTLNQDVPDEILNIVTPLADTFSRSYVRFPHLTAEKSLQIALAGVISHRLLK